MSNSTYTGPFQDHVPLRTSLEASPISDHQLHSSKSLIIPNRKRGWFSKLLRRHPSQGRETPEYRTLSGVAADEEELRQFKVDDEDEEEQSEEYEMLGGQKTRGTTSSDSHSRD